MNIPEGLHVNRPTPEGIELGKEFVRMLGPDIERLENMGVIPERCKSCALRLGTIPNGCPQTLMDFMECTRGDDTDFLCHTDGQLCSGFMAAKIVEIENKVSAPP